MKIIVSPAKEMSLENPISKDWKIKENTQKIVKALASLDENELKKKLKINDNILADVNNYIDGFNNNTTYKALEMYNGLAFRSLDYKSLDDIAKDYLDNNLYILSAFYGPNKGDSLVKPYRLDMTHSIKIDGKSLKNLWKDVFTESLENEDIVINLASNEFSDLIDRNKVKMLDFDFYMLKNGELKSHSTTSKKGKGMVARFMAINQIKNIDDIKNFNLDGYKFSEEKSCDSKFVFIKE